MLHKSCKKLVKPHQC